MKFRLSKYTRSEFLRNVFTLVSATGIAQAISLAIYPALSRLYEIEDFGLFSLYLSIVTITGIISTGKYEQAIMIPKSEKAASGLSFLSILLSLIFSLFLLVIILIFYNKLPGWLGNDHIKKWLWFIPLSTFMIAIFQTLGFWYNRKSRYKLIGGANLGQSAVNSAVKLSAAKMFENGGGLILGAIIGQVFGAIIYIVKVLREGVKDFLDFRVPEMKELLKEYSFFPRYNMPLRLVNNFSSSLPVFVFTMFFSATEAGFFGFGFMLINRPMNLISNAITKVFSQRVIEKHNNMHRIFPDIRGYVKKTILISIIPFGLLAAIGPWAVDLIFGDSYYEAGVYMRIFVPWLFFVFPSAPLSFLADLLKRQRKAMWIENFKFISRIVSLAIGVVSNDVYIALYLFSGSSMFFAAYSLFWYMKLARQADINKTNQEVL